MTRRFQKFLVALAGVSALGACANMPSGMRDAINGVALPTDSAEDRVHGAMALLEQGEEDRAKSQLEGVLRRDPGNTTAQRLLDQINEDPRAQLGQRSRPHVVRAGETMSSLAERHLGDPLMFYALARYNNMAPNELEPGQTIQIPDRGRRSSAALRPVHPPRDPDSLRGTSNPTAIASIPPLAAASPAPVVNSAASARANRLRLQGLERLNAGDANAAVNLLQQARALDGANAAIQQDLTRAQRIQASLRAQ